MRRGLVASRAEAQRLIDDGRVIVSGAPADKPARLVGRADPVEVLSGEPRYASRGGHKLAGVLEAIGVDPDGRSCLDAGASTGGFTDVLLRGGATRVIAVDVGYGQLAWHLRRDPRVVVLDRTNIRSLEPRLLPPPPPDLVVADLSFISLRVVIPALRRIAARDAEFLLLVKPQFEAGPERVGRGGVVRDPGVWRSAAAEVAAAAGAASLGVRAAVPSPLPGPAGNVEFFLHLRGDAPRHPSDATHALLDEAVAKGRTLRDATRGAP